MGADSIEHYAQCQIAGRLAAAHLGLRPLDSVRREGTPLQHFLCLSGEASEIIATRALHVYAVYKATNATRHTGSNCADVWRQAVRENVL